MSHFVAMDPGQSHNVPECSRVTVFYTKYRGHVTSTEAMFLALLALKK